MIMMILLFVFLYIFKIVALDLIFNAKNDEC